VRLGNVVRLREDIGPAQIDRLDRQRSITIVGNMLHGVPLGAAMTHTESVARRLDMPALYDIQWGGRAKDSARATRTSCSPSA
jgi:hydrophobic/amphiphilic exporter-1 (mainly G- bacteria), HAE1 family